MAEENRKMGAGKKIVIVLIVILLLCTVGAYAYGVYYFSSHFLPGSTVNGFNCSYMTAGEAESLLQECMHMHWQSVRRIMDRKGSQQRTWDFPISLLEVYRS